MMIAILSSFRSKDPSVSVGAVVTGPARGELLSFGYNAFPKNSGTALDDPELSVKPYKKGKNGLVVYGKNDFTVHAEMNALIHNVSGVTNGLHLFVTLAPCEACTEWIRHFKDVRASYLTTKGNYTKIVAHGKNIVPFNLENAPLLRSLLGNDRDEYNELYFTGKGQSLTWVQFFAACAHVMAIGFENACVLIDREYHILAAQPLAEMALLLQRRVTTKAVYAFTTYLPASKVLLLLVQSGIRTVFVSHKLSSEHTNPKAQPNVATPETAYVPTTDILRDLLQDDEFRVICKIMEVTGLQIRFVTWDWTQLESQSVLAMSNDLVRPEHPDDFHINVLQNILRCRGPTLKRKREPDAVNTGSCSSSSNTAKRVKSLK